MKLLNKISNNAKKKYKKLSKYLDLNKNYNISFNKVNDEKKLILSDNKKKKIIGDFKFYGYYNVNGGTWTWANIISNMNQKNIKYIEDLRTKAYIIEKNLSGEIDMFFYQFLTNDIFKIPEDRYLSLITDLLLYLSEDMYIFRPVNSKNNMQFIGLSSIDTLF